MELAQEAKVRHVLRILMSSLWLYNTAVCWRFFSSKEQYPKGNSE
jgi:hypothetical protein